MEKSKVKMVVPDSGKVTRKYNQTIQGVASLGKQIKISPKSHVVLNTPGYKSEYFVPTVSVNIGIGNDHTADLVMSEEAWRALMRGETITIETAKTFAEKYL